MEPYLGLSPANLQFGRHLTQLPLEIRNYGQGTLTWSVTADSSWVTILPPTSGSGDATIQVQVDRSGFPAHQDFQSFLRVTSNGGNANVLVEATTRDPVSTREATWGAIKALYR